MARVTIQAEHDERTERLREQAFLSWQMACIWGGKSAPSLTEWYANLGLTVPGEQPNAAEIERQRQEALAAAERVIELDKRRRQ